MLICSKSIQKFLATRSGFVPHNHLWSEAFFSLMIFRTTITNILPKEMAVVIPRMILMISMFFMIQVRLFKYTNTAIKVCHSKGVLTGKSNRGRNHLATRLRCLTRPPQASSGRPRLRCFARPSRASSGGTNACAERAGAGVYVEPRNPEVGGNLYE